MPCQSAHPRKRERGDRGAFKISPPYLVAVPASDVKLRIDEVRSQSTLGGHREVPSDRPYRGTCFQFHFHDRVRSAYQAAIHEYAVAHHVPYPGLSLADG